MDGAGATRSWHDPANWSPAVVPGAGDEAVVAVLGNNGPPVVAVADVAVGSLLAAQPIVVEAGRVLALGPGVSQLLAGIENRGTVEAAGTVNVMGNFDNSGSVRTPGLLSSTGAFSGAGTVDVAGGEVSLRNTGFAAGARIIGAGRVDVSGSGAFPPGLLDMEAALSFDGAGGAVVALSGPARSGPVAVERSVDLTFDGGVWDADVTVSGYLAPTVLHARGFIRRLEVGDTLDLLGTLATEDFLQTGPGILLADVPAQGEFDRIVSSGPAALGGTLTVTPTGVPVAGSRLPVVSGVPLTGRWGAVAGQDPYTVAGGTLVGPPVDVTAPTAVDVGGLDVGATASRTVTVTNNAGNARVELTAVVSDGFAGGGPVYLDPGASTEIPVSFSPVAPGAVEGALTIGPRTVALRGSGNPPPSVEPPPLLCNGVQLALLDLQVRGKRLTVSGIARSSYAGATVTLRSGSRTLGTAVVLDDGTFSARVPKPLGRHPRVQAVIGRAVSQRLQLKRALRIVSRRVDGDELVVRARIVVKRPPKRVEVFRQDSCSERTRVARPKVTRGRVTVRLPIREASDRVDIFRVVAKLRGGRTYTLPIAIRR